MFINVFGKYFNPDNAIVLQEFAHGTVLHFMGHSVESISWEKPIEEVFGEINLQLAKK